MCDDAYDDDCVTYIDRCQVHKLAECDNVTDCASGRSITSVCCIYNQNQPILHQVTHFQTTNVFSNSWFMVGVVTLRKLNISTSSKKDQKMLDYP